MLFSRTLGSTCLAINVTRLSVRGRKCGRKFIFRMLSQTKERLVACRSIGSDTTANTHKHDDLLVNYLDGENSGVVVFGLNRPDAKNSFSKSLVKQLEEAVESVKFDTNARVIILRSTTPGIFCAGADLKERATMPPQAVGPAVAKARRLIYDLENLPMPVIAAIDGHALGMLP